MVLEIIRGLKVASQASTKQTPDYIEFEDGTVLWNASLVLLNFICEHEGALKGKRVLELGSGLGHLAVGLCRIGAHVTCTERPKELLDLRSSVDHQMAASRPGESTEQALPPPTQQSEGGTIEAMELEWGEDAFSRSPLARAEAPLFDAIILAEVVYNTSVHEALLWTIQRFSHPGIVIYSVLVDRPFSLMFFANLHDVGCFEVEDISEYDALGMDREALHMHRITMKK